LVIVIEVTEAIPGEDAIKARSECQLSHIGNKPFLFIGWRLGDASTFG
jgi:hypothetical protein